VSAAAVERETVGIAEAIGENLVSAAAPDEGIVARDSVGRAVVDVQPQYLAKQLRGILPITDTRGVAEPDVVLVTAIADREVQVAVGAEGERAAVVIEIRMIELQEDALRGRVGAIRIFLRDPELGEPIGVVPTVGRALPQRHAIIDEEATVGGEVWVEGQAKQATFVVGLLEPHDSIAQIQEWALQ